MEILRLYIQEPKFQIMLQSFWNEQVVVSKAGRFYGRPFITDMGLTQGIPVSPTVFHIVVDTVLRVVMM